MIQIPFSKPVIDEDVIREMHDTLTNTKWLTSGPKVKALENEAGKYIHNTNVLCVNSWTSGAMLVLHWFGIKPGDEVIVPAYSYCATAMCVMNLGATPVMVDVKDDFTIDPKKIKKEITPRTKAIIPVDLGGYPADYDSIKKIICSKSVIQKFKPETDSQKELGRILLLGDAAHSLGAMYHGKMIGNIADITVFSLHSVKNITTGEGGIIALNMPPPFKNAELTSYLKTLSLNGQNKSALDKNKPGAWRYDIIAHGLKVNMPDLCATIGLSQIRRYEKTFLPERKRIYYQYRNAFSKNPWAIIPKYDDSETESSYHLFLLRIKDMSEEQRDLMIQLCSEKGVGVNVHYIPMPMLSLFKKMGYMIKDYPESYKLYQNEISLPIYNNLSKEEVELVIQTIREAYQTVKQKRV